MELQKLVERCGAIRQAYHELEVKHHDSKWTVKKTSWLCLMILEISNDW